MDIRWLEDLLALAETRNFRKASELRHVTQPGLSRRIQSLERWATVPLIDRAASPLELTEHGRSLAAVAADIVQRLRHQRLAFADLKRTASRNLVIAAPTFFSFAFLPKWLPRIEQALGEIRLTMLSGQLAECRNLIEEGKAHLLVGLLDHDGVIARRSRPWPALDAGLAAVVGQCTYVPLSAPDASGNPRHAIGTDRASVELIGYAEDCALGWAIDELLARRPDIRLTCRRESAYSEAVRGMTLAGMGAAWLPESATRRERSAGLLVRAGDASLDIPCDIVAIRPARRLPPLAESVWHLLTQAKIPPGAKRHLVGCS